MMKHGVANAIMKDGLNYVPSTKNPLSRTTFKLCVAVLARDFTLFLKHIVGSQIKNSRYKGLYVSLPLMDFNEKLMDFNGF